MNIYSLMWVSAPQLNVRPFLDLSEGWMEINMQTSAAMTLTRTFDILQAWEMSGLSPPHL